MCGVVWCGVVGDCNGDGSELRRKATTPRLLPDGLDCIHILAASPATSPAMPFPRSWHNCAWDGSVVKVVSVMVWTCNQKASSPSFLDVIRPQINSCVR